MEAFVRTKVFCRSVSFVCQGKLGCVWLSGDEEGGSCRVGGWGTGGRVSASWGRCVLSSLWHGTGYVFEKRGAYLYLDFLAEGDIVVGRMGALQDENSS